MRVSDRLHQPALLSTGEALEPLDIPFQQEGYLVVEFGVKYLIAKGFANDT